MNLLTESQAKILHDFNERLRKTESKSKHNSMSIKSKSTQKIFYNSHLKTNTSTTNDNSNNIEYKRYLNKYSIPELRYQPEKQLQPIIFNATPRDLETSSHYNNENSILFKNKTIFKSNKSPQDNKEKKTILKPNDSYNLNNYSHSPSVPHNTHKNYTMTQSKPIIGDLLKVRTEQPILKNHIKGSIGKDNSLAGKGIPPSTLTATTLLSSLSARAGLAKTSIKENPMHKINSGIIKNSPMIKKGNYGYASTPDKGDIKRGGEEEEEGTRQYRLLTDYSDKKPTSFEFNCQYPSERKGYNTSKGLLKFKPTTTIGMASLLEVSSTDPIKPMELQRPQGMGTTGIKQIPLESSSKDVSDAKKTFTSTSNTIDSTKDKDTIIEDKDLSGIICYEDDRAKKRMIEIYSPKCITSAAKIIKTGKQVNTKEDKKNSSFNNNISKDKSVLSTSLSFLGNEQHEQLQQPQDQLSSMNDIKSGVYRKGKLPSSSMGKILTPDIMTKIATVMDDKTSKILMNDKPSNILINGKRFSMALNDKEPDVTMSEKRLSTATSDKGPNVMMNDKRSNLMINGKVTGTMMNDKTSSVLKRNKTLALLGGDTRYYMSKRVQIDDQVSTEKSFESYRKTRPTVKHNTEHDNNTPSRVLNTSLGSSSLDHEEAVGILCKELGKRLELGLLNQQEFMTILNEEMIKSKVFYSKIQNLIK